MLWCHGDYASGSRMLVGGAASHPVAVVGTVVVAGEPGVGLDLELVDAEEASPVEGGTPAFVEHGLVEAFHHGVVVRGPGRDTPVGDAELVEVAGEAVTDELGAVVGDHCGDRVTTVTPAACDQVNEAGGESLQWDVP